MERLLHESDESDETLLRHLYTCRVKHNLVIVLVFTLQTIKSIRMECIFRLLLIHFLRN